MESGGQQIPRTLLCHFLRKPRAASPLTAVTMAIKLSGEIQEVPQHKQTDVSARGNKCEPAALMSILALCGSFLLLPVQASGHGCQKLPFKPKDSWALEPGIPTHVHCLVEGGRTLKVANKCSSFQFSIFKDNHNLLCSWYGSLESLRACSGHSGEVRVLGHSTQ